MSQQRSMLSTTVVEVLHAEDTKGDEKDDVPSSSHNTSPTQCRSSSIVIQPFDEAIPAVSLKRPNLMTTTQKKEDGFWGEHLETVAETWSCSACTLVNDGASGYCAACDARRPGSVNVSSVTTGFQNSSFPDLQEFEPLRVATPTEIARGSADDLQQDIMDNLMLMAVQEYLQQRQEQALARAEDEQAQVKLDHPWDCPSCGARNHNALSLDCSSCNKLQHADKRDALEMLHTIVLKIVAEPDEMKYRRFRRDKVEKKCCVPHHFDFLAVAESLGFSYQQKDGFYELTLNMREAASLLIQFLREAHQPLFGVPPPSVGPHNSRPLVQVSYSKSQCLAMNQPQIWARLKSFDFFARKLYFEALEHAHDAMAFVEAVPDPESQVEVVREMKFIIFHSLQLLKLRADRYREGETEQPSAQSSEIEGLLRLCPKVGCETCELKQMVMSSLPPESLVRVLANQLHHLQNDQDGPFSG